MIMRDRVRERERESDNERVSERRVRGRMRVRESERERYQLHSICQMYLEDQKQSRCTLILQIKFHFSVAEMMLFACYVLLNTLISLSYIGGRDLHHHTDLLRYLMEFISVILCGFVGLFPLCMKCWQEQLEEHSVQRTQSMPLRNESYSVKQHSTALNAAVLQIIFHSSVGVVMFLTYFIFQDTLFSISYTISGGLYPTQYYWGKLP